MSGASEFPFEMLRSLKADWDSYGADPINERCIQKAYEIWRQLSGRWDVVPTNNSGVQLEQHRDGFDIEIRIELSMSPAPSAGTRGIIP